MGEWIKKCGPSTHTGTLLNLKKERILTQATTRMDLESITLSEINQ